MKEFATDDEIRHAETVLFGRQNVFDKDRIKVIKKNVSCDVQACPGSGKTTTLLAKLVILANRLPLTSGRGICVLTHTNVAIDEIKLKLGGKASQLFSYPNFFGTIQSFVDTYLSNAALYHYYGSIIKAVDNDKAYAALAKRYNSLPFGNPLRGYIYNILGNGFKTINDDFNEYELNLLIGKGLAEIKKSSKQIKIITQKTSIQKLNQIDIPTDIKNKIRLIRQRINNGVKKRMPEFLAHAYLDFSKSIPYVKSEGKVSDFSCSSPSGNEFKEIKEKCFSEGILSYQDSYHLALRYLKDFPQLKDAISKRFEYLFLDEMQDTDSLQNLFLKSAFDPKETIIQKFGDSDQAIYDSIKKEEKKWVPKKPLFIHGSIRFGENIAKVLRSICVEDNNGLQGNPNIHSLKPIIILFDDPSTVLPKFYELIHSAKIDEEMTISDFAKEYSLHNGGKCAIKAIGWIKEGKDREKLGITSYFPKFNVNHSDTRKAFDKFSDYISWNINNTIKDISSQIKDGLLALLRRMEIKSSADRYYTKTTLLDVLDSHGLKEAFFTNTAKWSADYISNKIGVNSLTTQVRDWLCENNWIDLNAKQDIFNSFFDVQNSLQENLNLIAAENKYNDEIEVSTVHGVKGETHIATLYMETCYNQKCESERLEAQIKGAPYRERAHDTYVKQALKVAYVGMSRPRYLLCFAVQKGHLSQETLNSMEFQERWEIETI